MITAYLIYKYLIMKNLKNLGKSLNNEEQKAINGGGPLRACSQQEYNNGCYETRSRGCICPVSDGY